VFVAAMPSVLRAWANPFARPEGPCDDHCVPNGAPGAGKPAFTLQRPWLYGATMVVWIALAVACFATNYLALFAIAVFMAVVQGVVLFRHLTGRHAS
jgi:hypothetical protein